jgi:purine-nucleoside phosphorylase
MKTKKQIREMLQIGNGGRIQINFHGCGDVSILIFRKNSTSEYNIKENLLYA